jgi:hypothetical protein
MKNTQMFILQSIENPIDDALLNRYIADNFTFSIYKYINSKNMDKYLTELTNKDLKHTCNTFELSSRKSNYYIEGEDLSFFIFAYDVSIESTFIQIFAKTIDVANKIFNLAKQFECEKNNFEIYIDSYYTDDRGFKISTTIRTEKDFAKLDKDYVPYIDINKMFKLYCKSESNVLLLTGGSGLGKTKIIDLFQKFLISNVDFIQEHLNSDKYIEEEDGVIRLYVAYVKNPDILAKDSFWTGLENKGYVLIILDDFDYMLGERSDVVNSIEDKNKNNFMSYLLSYTDGIFSSKVNTKFIITTNQQVNTMDKASLREKRMFDILNLRPLTHKEALVIWKKFDLSEEEFNLIFEDIGKITASKLSDSIDNIINIKELDLSDDNYLLEEGISIMDKSKNPKRVGF